MAQEIPGLPRNLPRERKELQAPQKAFGPGRFFRQQTGIKLGNRGGARGQYRPVAKELSDRLRAFALAVENVDDDPGIEKIEPASYRFRQP
jgi:hypothetical protein